MSENDKIPDSASIAAGCLAAALALLTGILIWSALGG